MTSSLPPLYIETNTANEYYTDERCSIIELLNKPDDRSQSMARARVKPGVKTAWHKLNGTSEVYYILEGEGIAELGDEVRQVMKPHSLIRIPAGMHQRITNTGTKDLIFLCVCVPAFDVENYVTLDK